MSPREIYLDNNSTTQTLPEVRQAMLDALDAGFGNASSVHSAGERVRTAIRAAREQVAALISAPPESLLFTSGATESNNLVIASALRSTHLNERPRLLTTAVEHSSILNVVQHCSQRELDVVLLPVDARGHIDLNRIEHALAPRPRQLRRFAHPAALSIGLPDRSPPAGPR